MAKTTLTLDRIGRTNLVLAAAATAIGGLVWQGPGMLAAGVGAALACANFWLVGRMAARALAAVAGGATSEVATRATQGLLARLMAKMIALMAIIWILLSTLDLAVAPFTLGISIFVVSIILAAASIGLRGAEEVC